MTFLSVTRGGVVLLAMLVPLSLHAQSTEAWSQCRMDSLAGWNCASYYSGTVTMGWETRTSPPVVQTVTATITAGRVVCRLEGTDTERFEAPGMVAVSPGGTMGGGEYEIVVWCPEAADEPVSRDSWPTIEIRDRRAADYALLEGTDAWEDREEAAEDPATQVRVTWRLRR